MGLSHVTIGVDYSRLKRRTAAVNRVPGPTRTDLKAPRRNLNVLGREKARAGPHPNRLVLEYSVLNSPDKARGVCCENSLLLKIETGSYHRGIICQFEILRVNACSPVVERARPSELAARESVSQRRGQGRAPGA